MEKKLNKAEAASITQREATTFVEVVTKILLDKKYNVRTYLRVLIEKHMTDNLELEIDEVKAAVESTFNQTLSQKERQILKTGLDSKGGKMTINELRDKLKAGMTDEADKMRLHVQLVAMLLDKRQVSTCKICFTSSGFFAQKWFGFELQFAY